ncbi:P-loop NTPase fold protein [Rhodovarius crocodyli]|nr:P-loop NTPase fold protein [Rhodovarius crocodyli]
MLLSAVAILLAVYLPLRADPFRTARFGEPAWWFEVPETHGFGRLPQAMAGISALAMSSDGRTVLAAGGGGTIVRSTDAGANWQPVTSGTQSYLSALAMSSDGRTVLAAGSGGTILRSTDAGANWQPVTSGARSFLFGMAMSSDGRTVLAAGGGGTILRSTDAGANWQPVTSGTQNHLTSLAMGSDGRTVLAAGSGGTILRSTDADANWQPVTSGTQNFLYSLAMGSDGRTVLAAGYGGTILRSTDAGATWQPVTSGTQSTLSALAMDSDGRTVLAAGDGGTILRSTDAGATWQPVTSGTRSFLFGMAMSSDGRTVLAAGSGGTILRSTDSGLTWNRIEHRRHFPPITWLLIGLGLIVAMPAFLPLPPAKPRAAEDIAAIFATDRPLEAKDADVAGTDLLAQRLSYFLRHVRTAPPLTLAITGPWGSGKSSVCARLCDDLRARGLRPIWFNAWHHQKEENIFAALLQAVRQRAIPPAWRLDGLAVRFRLLAARMRRYPLWTAFFLGAVAVGLGMIAGNDWAQSLSSLRQAWTGQTWSWPQVFPVILPGLLIVTGLLKALGEFGATLKSAGLDPGKLLASTSHGLRTRDLGAQLSFRARFAEALQETADALGPRTLTIVVDDLDRCRPDQVAEIMETLNYLTGSARCFIVLAIAREHVLAAMGQAHATMAKEMARPGLTDERLMREEYAENYLRKLIQIEIPVPSFDAEAAVRLMQNAAEEAEQPADKAWKVPVWTMVATVFVAGCFWTGTWLMRPTPPSAPAVAVAAVQAPAATPAPAPQPAPPPPRPTEEAPRQAASGIEYHELGQAITLRDWLLITAGLAGLLVAAVWLQWLRRNRLMLESDAPLFALALQHWARAAFLARPSPREMKRFLNRLRLAASHPAAPTAPVTVGLAVIAHADISLLEQCVEGRVELLAEILKKAAAETEPHQVWQAIHSATGAAVEGLPPFAPSHEDMENFLASWSETRRPARQAPPGVTRAESP